MTGAPPRAGQLARLQRILVLALVLVSLAWLLAWWPHSKTVALTGFVLIALVHTSFLAIESAASWFVNRRGAVPPSAGSMLKAWLIECTTTPRVFYWRQPFFSNAVPDHLPAPGASTPRRGMVLVHGLVCNRAFWNPWLARLRADGRAFVAVTLEPMVASIDAYADAVDRAVRQVTLATGQPPLLVCHSMGGLVARAWLRRAGDAAAARVWRIVTIGSPHQGTWLARFSPTVNGKQMRLDSDWLRTLRESEPPARDTLFTCWYSNCDNIVFPALVATLPGADNRFLPGVPHVALGFVPQVMQHTFALLDAETEGESPCGPIRASWTS